MTPIERVERPFFCADSWQSQQQHLLFLHWTTSLWHQQEKSATGSSWANHSVKVDWPRGLLEGLQHGRKFHLLRLGSLLDSRRNEGMAKFRSNLS
jgi:hypothetical protein